MNTCFDKPLKGRDIIFRILVVLLALLAIAAYIKPIFSLFSSFVELHRTYAYTEEEKHFLKYEDGYIHTTDGCKYQDKDGNFAKLVIEEQLYKIEEGNPVTVFTSSFTNEVIRVEVYQTDYPYSCLSVNIIPDAEWIKYDTKETEVHYLQTACTFIILMAFFVAVAASVFFTKNTERRNIYALLYLIAIPACFLAFIADKKFSDAGSPHTIVICLLILLSFAYGFAAHLLSRRIFLPSSIFASSLALLSMTGITDIVSKPMVHIVDFLYIPLCVSVLGALVSVICFWLLKHIAKRRNKAIDEIKFFGKVFSPSQTLDEKPTGFRAQFTPVVVFFAVTVIPLFYQIALSGKDWGGMVYAFLLIAVFIIHGILSFWKTKKIILPNLIIIALYILLSMVNYDVGFNSTPENFLLASLSSLYLFVICSLPVPTIWFIVRKIRSFLQLSKKSVLIPNNDDSEQNIE